MIRRSFLTILIVITVVLASVLVGSRFASPTGAAPLGPARTHVCSTTTVWTWSPGNSPYQIDPNCTFIIPHGQTLHIQAGVSIYAASGAQLLVNGTLTAAGTAANHISFSCPSNPCGAGTWQGIQFLPSSSASSVLTYVDISGANTAINDYPGTTLANLSFANDSTAINYDGQSLVNGVTVSAATFTDVGMGIDGHGTNMGLTVLNCSFSSSTGAGTAVSNDAGFIHASGIHIQGLAFGLVTGTGSINLQNSIFQMFHTTSRGIDITGSGSLAMSGTTIQSTLVAIFAQNAPGAITVTTSNLVNNHEALAVDVQTNNIALSNNNIYGNDINIYISSGRTDVSVNATNNWWGTTDEAAIQATFHDCTVDNTLPCVVFKPVRGTPAGGAPTLTPTATVTGTVTRTPTRTPTVTVTPTPGAELNLSPNSQAAGSTQGVNANGGGFLGHESVVISYTVPLDNGTNVTEQTTVTTFSNGTFSTTLTPVVAGAQPGTYTVTAVGGVSHRSASATLTVLAPTATSTPVPTATNTPIPATPTNTPAPTATDTPVPPTETPTATSVPKKKYVLNFKSATLQYPYVRVGTWERIVVKANHHQKLDVALHVIFPAAKSLHFSAKTNKRGYWNKQFSVPRGAIGKRSRQVIVVIQLRHGLTTKQMTLQFTLVR